MAKPPAPLRMLRIDDHVLFRESLARTLDAEPGFEVSHCAPVAEARRLIHQGVSRIILKESPLEALAEAIRSVAAGGVWLDQRFLRVIVGLGAPAEGGASRPALSDREQNALQQWFRKSGVRNRSRLVRVALEQYLDQVWRRRLLWWNVAMPVLLPGADVPDSRCSCKARRGL